LFAKYIEERNGKSAKKQKKMAQIAEKNWKTA